MTTIAYRDGIVAADSQSTAGYARDPNPVQKLHEYGKHIVALCGNGAFSQAFLAWVNSFYDEKFRPKVDDHDDLHCITFDRDTSGVTVKVYGKHCLPHTTINPVYMAWGSGAEYALGAMAVGATAEEAVKAAIAHDIYSGGKVQTMELREVRPLLHTEGMPR